MSLDPQARRFLDGLPEIEDLDSIDVGEFRKLYSAFAGGLAAKVDAPIRSVDRHVPGRAGTIPVRIYAPEAPGPLPVVVFFHGGGWVVCDLDTHDGVCRDLAHRAGCVVVSVDYRRAPEHRFPAAAEDCYAATSWVVANAEELGADPRRVAVAGDSAGGNLAAVVALMARDQGGPALVHQLLIYPVTNHAFDTDSYGKNGAGYLLTRDTMQWFWGRYLADPADGANPLASPLRAGSLAGLAAATVITAGFDPLRDEGAAYADRLREAGVPVTHSDYPGMIHGFWSMAGVLDEAVRAMDEVAGRLREAFGRRGSLG